MQPNAKNERIKRKFFRWLKEADGCCGSTVNCIEKAILLYEDFTKHDDFAHYSEEKAIGLKNWLRGRNLSLATYSTYLRYLRKFFKWLSQQSGYKSRIRLDLVDYLKLTDREERVATQSPRRNYPSLEYVINLTDSIQVDSEVDQRDRALIAFTLLSGMRDRAITTLPLGCFDEENMAVYQNPKQGVDTKFAKTIESKLFRFDQKLVSYILDWVKHLKGKGFGSEDPLFPRSKLEKGGENLSFETSRQVENIYWHGTGRMREIFKKRTEKANLPYFPPHTFRHLAVDLALQHCKTGDEIKAISQNFGHEHIATTLSEYGNYGTQRLFEVIDSIDFSNKTTKRDAAIPEEIIQKVARSLRKITIEE